MKIISIALALVLVAVATVQAAPVPLSNHKRGDANILKRSGLVDVNVEDTKVNTDVFIKPSGPPISVTLLKRRLLGANGHGANNANKRDDADFNDIEEDFHVGIENIRTGDQSP